MVGQKAISFVAEILPDVKAAIEGNAGQVIDIRGGSGTGKSRIMRETLCRSRQTGWRTLAYDCALQGDDSLFRSMLRELIGPAIFTGSSHFGPDDLRTVFQKTGHDPADSRKVYDFLVGRRTIDDIYYHIGETIKHFVGARASHSPIVLIMDNVQELNPTFYPCIENLVDYVCNAQQPICLCLTTNTEVVPLANRSHLDGFLLFLDSKRRVRQNYIRQHECDEFSSDDARHFVFALIPEMQEHTELTDLLISKAGRRPLDLEIVLDHLVDEKGVRIDNYGRLYVPDLFKLHNLLDTVPPDLKGVLDKRVSNLRSTHDELEKKHITVLFESVLAFRGSLPIAYIEGIGLPSETCDNLVRKRFLRYERTTESVGFYHNTLYRFFSEKATYRVSNQTSKSVLEWLDGASDSCGLESNVTGLIRYFCYRRLGDTSSALLVAEDAIGQNYSTHNHLNVSEVGGDVLLACEGQLPRPSTRPGLFRSLCLYGDSLVQHIDSHLGLGIFQLLFQEFIQDDLSDTDLANHFLHLAANANIHNRRGAEAIRILQFHESKQIASGETAFLLQDRFAVAFTDLGDEAKARHHIEAAIRVAEGLADSMWLSIGYSDAGYIHLHLSHDREKMIQCFEQAMCHYENSKKRPLFRQIEILQQKAFVDLLCGEFEASLRRADEALWLCRRACYSLFEVRIINLKAVVHAVRGEWRECIHLLQTAISRAEIFRVAPGRWKSYCNLGAVLIVQGRFMEGLQQLLIAKNVWECSCGGATYSIKDRPLFSNLALAMCLAGEPGEPMLKDVDNDLQTLFARLRKCVRPGNLSTVPSTTIPGLIQVQGVGFFIS